MTWKGLNGAQARAAENTWTKRSKVYKAKTFAALKELYGVTKPGHEPKGITTVKETKDGQLENNVVVSAAEEATSPKKAP